MLSTIQSSMLSKSRGGALRALQSTPYANIPAFLLPAFANFTSRASSSWSNKDKPVETDPKSLFGESRPPRPFDIPKSYKGKKPLDASKTPDATFGKRIIGKTPSEAAIAERRARRKEDGEDDWRPPPRLPWQSQKAALEEKFPEGWAPRKRLSPDALAGIRAIHAQFPDQYTVPVLAQKFEISPEAVRRILKSKWRPNEEEEEERTRRWYKRGKEVWTRYAELGLKPPRKWRDEGIGKRPKGWRSAEKEEREREAEELRTTRNPRYEGTSLRREGGSGAGDDFI